MIDLFESAVQLQTFCDRRGLQLDQSFASMRRMYRTNCGRPSR